MRQESKGNGEAQVSVSPSVWYLVRLLAHRVQVRDNPSVNDSACVVVFTVSVRLCKKKRIRDWDWK